MGSSPKLAARLLLHQLPELRKAGLPTPGKAALEELIEAVASGKLAKEGVDDALATLARGEVLRLESSSNADQDAFIDELLAERKDFVQQRRMEAMGPLMGAVMGEFRGRIAGALVSERLLVKLEEFLGCTGAHPGRWPGSPHATIDCAAAETIATGWRGAISRAPAARTGRSWRQACGSASGLPHARGTRDAR